MAARVIWLLSTGDWPKHTIDHINRDSWDNRWENLRDIPQSENSKNKGFYKDRPFKHLYFNKDRWGIIYDKKYHGSSKCLGEAVKLRNKVFREKGLPINPDDPTFNL